ncbi:MAG: tetratricopeptide repeat protein [Chitinophagaceae bacterium]|nr:tetratricopeptide repeat protein [Chitinophagaceae bacterium]
MKKQQFILSASGILLLLTLWFFGKTVANKDNQPAPEIAGKKSAIAFNIEEYLKSSKQKLTISQTNYVSEIENSISRGDVKTQQEKAYYQLASFWSDSLHNHELYVYYISKASMLVNSEKNLTFAARQILAEFRNEPDAAKRGWKAEQAIGLIQKAIELNPDNDSLKVDLGSCYVFGKGMAGDAQETMKGIQQLLQVVKKDSMNMQAQLVLGIGGVVSSQYEKAVERLQKVISNEPGNAEAVSWLAEAYAGKGDKENAVKWFNVSKRMLNNPQYSKEIDKRIEELK